jgi:SAM-dependent methyltransferase
MDLDDLAKYNRDRWDELAKAGVEFSRPLFDLDLDSARALIDPHNHLGELTGKEVLCLAAGGGQQSAAFGLLGARVTVFDLSAVQLEKDRLVSNHYQIDIKTVQGDMRDLSKLGGKKFDHVWHAYSINFIPALNRVFEQISAVTTPGGIYRLEFANPFVAGLNETDWDGEELLFSDPLWTIHKPDGTTQGVVGPREFRHTLSSVVNKLIMRGFILLGIWEELSKEPDAALGTWEHLKSIAPPWLTIWARYLPEIK